ncbi:MAG: hypothetical protein GXO03_03235 [Aquificae bacterium]|nr:hypothetical protein [Aquificota bacterium]
MQVEVIPRFTLVVDGPARVRVLKGECSVFGAKLKGELELPPFKRLPFRGSCLLEVEGGSYRLVRGSTVPAEWNVSGRGVLMVVGPTDAGKSSFCTFLINRLLSERKRVVFLDLDPGQSEVGPPCTLSLAEVNEPVPVLSLLPLTDFAFFGSTTPSGWEDYFTACAGSIFGRAPEFDALVVNTPGWVEGRGLQLLYSLKELLKPDETFVLGEVEFEGRKLPPSPYAKPRSRSERSYLRKTLYERFLRRRERFVISYGQLRPPCLWRDGLNCLGRRVELESPEGLFGALFKEERGVGFFVVTGLTEEGLVVEGEKRAFDAARLGRVRLKEDEELI